MRPSSLLLRQSPLETISWKATRAWTGLQRPQSWRKQPCSEAPLSRQVAHLSKLTVCSLFGELPVPEMTDLQLVHPLPPAGPSGDFFSAPISIGADLAENMHIAFEGRLIPINATMQLLSYANGSRFCKYYIMPYSIGSPLMT